MLNMSESNSCTIRKSQLWWCVHTGLNELVRMLNVAGDLDGGSCGREGTRKGNQQDFLALDTLCVCVCVCACVCVCVCVFKCACIHIFVYVCVYCVCVCLCMYTCMYVCVCVCVCRCVCVYVYVCVCVCVCVSMYMCLFELCWDRRV
jgi:hypothetical protein